MNGVLPYHGSDACVAIAPHADSDSLFFLEHGAPRCNELNHRLLLSTTIVVQ